jgi:hypothetical protein
LACPLGDDSQARKYLPTYLAKASGDQPTSLEPTVQSLLVRLAPVRSTVQYRINDPRYRLFGHTTVNRRKKFGRTSLYSKNRAVGSPGWLDGWMDGWLVGLVLPNSPYVCHCHARPGPLKPQATPQCACAPTPGEHLCALRMLEQILALTRLFAATINVAPRFASHRACSCDGESPGFALLLLLLLLLLWVRCSGSCALRSTKYALPGSRSSSSIAGKGPTLHDQTGGIGTAEENHQHLVCWIRREQSSCPNQHRAR